MYMYNIMSLQSWFEFHSDYEHLPWNEVYNVEKSIATVLIADIYMQLIEVLWRLYLKVRETVHVLYC